MAHIATRSKDAAHQMPTYASHGATGGVPPPSGLPSLLLGQAVLGHGVTSDVVDDSVYLQTQLGL